MKLKLRVIFLFLTFSRGICSKDLLIQRPKRLRMTEYKLLCKGSLPQPGGEVWWVQWPGVLRNTSLSEVYWWWHLFILLLQKYVQIYFWRAFFKILSSFWHFRGKFGKLCNKFVFKINKKRVFRFLIWHY